MTKEKSIPSRINITYKDVISLFGGSNTSAWRKIQTAKDSIGKKEKQILTIEEFCEVYGLDYDKTLKHLQLV